MEEFSNVIPSPSVKRIIGCAFLGIIVGGCLSKASDYTIPRLLAIIHKTDVQLESFILEDSIIYGFIIITIASFFGAAVAAFLAKRKGIIVGLLSNSLYIILWSFVLAKTIKYSVDKMVGSLSVQLYTFLMLLLISIASVLGGYLGQKFYSPELDLDLGNEKLTIFGIRWYNYLWIIPLILYPYLTSIIMILYAGIVAYLADFYFAIHPSLWFKISWWFYFFLVPILIYISVVLTFFGFKKFWGLFQFKQNKITVWKKLGKAVIFGIGVPLVSFPIATICAIITHNMPKPTSGDWKIGLIVLLIFPALSIIYYIFSWLKKFF